MSCLHRNRHSFDVLYCEGERLEWCAECGAIRFFPDGTWQPPFERRDTQPSLDNPTTEPPPPFDDATEPREAS
jgi:hypothetical protein